MCLIDEVIFWDNNNIQCQTRSHLNAQNPLRHDKLLSAIHLLEYGAQAMAIHGGLLHDTATPGFLAAIRQARLFIETLDTIDSPLTINATALTRSRSGVIYEFDITVGAQHLIQARATVIYSTQTKTEL